jgi:FkbM family methyltransferase
LEDLIIQDLILELGKKINNHKGEVGIFFEVGANDGVTQSNTLILEKSLKWNGILVEPIHSSYEKLKLNRPNCKLFNYFLCNDKKEKIIMEYDHSYKNLMASIYKKKFFELKRPKTTKVDTSNFNFVVEKSNFNQVDFLSLDVEGYELEILQSIDFKKYQPYAILIEVWKDKSFEIFDFLTKKNYIAVSNISNFSENTHPNWSGNHQDFLFIKKEFSKYYFS